MRFALFFVLSCLILVAAADAALAATVNYSFSFTNSPKNGGGSVRGVILGLEDNATGPAQSVRVTSADYGLGEYVSGLNPAPNIFTVVDGAVTTFRFQSIGRFNDPPAVLCCSLGMWRVSVGGDVLGGLANANDGVGFYPLSDFTLTRLVVGPTPVPLPAPVPLLASAMAALGWVGWRGKRTAPAGVR